MHRVKKKISIQDKSMIPGSSENWLNRINQTMENALYNPNMNNRKMARELNLSERDLFRKVKNSTGLSPQKYFRRYRLRRAMSFLREGKYKTVKEVSKIIGYSNVSYFIVQFEKEFTKKPLQILKEYGWR